MQILFFWMQTANDATSIISSCCLQLILHTVLAFAMPESGNDAPSCTILYSTQTGRARACARRTARILKETTNFQLLGGTAFDEASPSFLELAAAQSKVSGNTNHFFLLFVSTTGDGVQCDSIQQTWKSLLKKSLTPKIWQQDDAASTNSFALFCLGERAYGPHFCAAGRKLAVRLLQLGMTTTCEVGYSDDNTPNGGVFADLDQWIEKELLQSPLVKQYRVTNVSMQPSSGQQEGPMLSQYRVLVQNPQEQSPIEAAKDEWQQKWCRQAHQSFVASRSPITAYTYENYRRVNSAAEDNGSELIKNKNPLIGHVERNERLTAQEWGQNTRHIRLRVTHSEESTTALSNNGTLAYQAGDIATILPSNPPTEVERFIQTLPLTIQQNVDKELTLDFQSSDQKGASFGGAYPFWPRQCTLRGWLTHCADIHSLPEREDLRALSPFCSTEHSMAEAQRNKLVSLSETSESALYVDYILRERRCWTDVFYDFDSLRHGGSLLTVEALLMLLPPIRPRDFSIASSPTHEKLIHQDDQCKNMEGFIVELCVAVVEGTTPLGRTHHGLCSHYLSQLQVKQSQLRLWIRPGSFAGLPLTPRKLDDSHESATANAKRWFENPVLCIGAGTGIAPLRALIKEREAVKRMSERLDPAKGTLPIGENSMLDQYDNLLVFGCRKKGMDYYYQNEWKQLEESGRLKVLPAFSQEQTHKIYVQQIIKANAGAILRHILENDGAIYIAGNPSMARYSKEELVEATALLMGENGEKKANLLFKKLQTRGLFSVEAWS